MKCGVSEPGLERRILKRSIVKIAIKARLLEIEVSDNKVLPSRARGIRGVRPHARLGAALAAHGNSGKVAHLAKRPVTIIVEKKVGHGVVGNKNVLPTVVVIIECDHPEPVPRHLPYSRGFAHVCKSAVAIIVIEGGRLPVVNVRMAVAAIPFLMLSTPNIVLR